MSSCFEQLVMFNGFNEWLANKTASVIPSNDTVAQDNPDLTAKAFTLVALIFVPVLLLFVVTFCSPSNRKRRLFQRSNPSVRPLSQKESPKPGPSHSKKSPKQETTIINMVNMRETVVLSNCRVSQHED